MSSIIHSLGLFRMRMRLTSALGIVSRINRFCFKHWTLCVIAQPRTQLFVEIVPPSVHESTIMNIVEIFFCLWRRDWRQDGSAQPSDNGYCLRKSMKSLEWYPSSWNDAYTVSSANINKWELESHARQREKKKIRKTSHSSIQHTSTAHDQIHR